MCPANTRSTWCWKKSGSYTVLKVLACGSAVQGMVLGGSWCRVLHTRWPAPTKLQADLSQTRGKSVQMIIYLICAVHAGLVAPEEPQAAESTQVQGWPPLAHHACALVLLARRTAAEHAPDPFSPACTAQRKNGTCSRACRRLAREYAAGQLQA